MACPGYVSLLPLVPRRSGDIYDILVLGAKNTIVVATDSGLVVEHSANDRRRICLGLRPGGQHECACRPVRGTNSSVIAYQRGMPGAFAVGTWQGATLTWTDTTPDAAHPDSRMATVVASMSNGSRSHPCAADRNGSMRRWPMPPMPPGWRCCVRMTVERPGRYRTPIQP